MRSPWLALPMAALLSLGTAALFVPACATDANNVSGCRQIEFARCTRATGCGIDLQGLLPTGSSEADQISACQSFYEDACLHGLATTVTVTQAQINQCTNEISAVGGDCNYVVNPQTAPNCTFLIPPDAGTDATDADVAVPDVVVVVVVEDSGTVSDGAADALADCYSACDSDCSGDTACISACEMNCQS